MTSEKAERPRRVTFPGHDGFELSGLFQVGRLPIKGAVLICHCFTCSKDYKVLSWLSRGLAERGYSALRFDFAGLGESGGDFRETTLSTDVEDALSAAAWMKEQGSAPSALIGHSMGGAAAALAASRLGEVRTVTTLGTSYRLGWRIRQLLRPPDLEVLEKEGETGVVINDRLFPVTREFLQDLERHSLLETAAGWSKGLLVVHGTADRVVPVSDAEAFFEAAAQPKAFLGVPGGTHLLDRSRHEVDGIAEVATRWIELNRPADEASE